MNVDKRKHSRRPREEKIFVEILSASDSESSDNVLLECTTSDISEKGLRIQSQYPLILDSILELLISFETGGFKFLLTGEVKWMEEMADGQFAAGFQLIDAEHSDYLVWQNMFESVSV